MVELVFSFQRGGFCFEKQSFATLVYNSTNVKSSFEWLMVNEVSSDDQEFRSPISERKRLLASSF